MSILQAVLLGAVQGVTEFFPVSSSGHLTLISNLMGIESSTSLMFVVMLHIGTLLAVIAVFYRDILRLLSELVRMIGDLFCKLKLWLGGHRNPENVRYRKIVSSNYRKFALMLLVSMIPTSIIGYLICPVSEAVTGNLLASGMGLLITALLLLVSSFMLGSDKGPREAKYVDAFLVGAFQGFSGFPGISRLGMTVSSSYLSGFSRKFVLKYSFILCVPTILGAIILEGTRTHTSTAALGVGPCLAGMAASAVVGFFIIRLAVRLISKKRNRIFAAYCIIIGIISVVGYLK